MQCLHTVGVQAQNWTAERSIGSSFVIWEAKYGDAKFVA